MAVRLAAFDLDGTLVRGPTCVEVIGRAIGRAQQCALFEKLSMRDVAGITAAREEMASWYRCRTPEELVSGLSDLQLAPGAEEAFVLLRSRGIATAIGSMTWSFAVDWLAARLGADYTLGTRLTESSIVHVWPEDKGTWLARLAARLRLRGDEVAAVGDSDGDREMLEAAGLRVFVGARAPALPGIAHLPQGDLLEVARRILAAA